MVATCAYTGIAATLLINGMTLHSLFRLPVPITNTHTCNVSPTSKHGAFLREINLFVFDECSMIPKYAVHAIDVMLRDITSVNIPFSGKIILLGGDFRQILPVVRKGKAIDIIDVCLKRSPLSSDVTSLHLTRNMRARPEELQFSNWLLHLGAGQLPLKVNDPYEGPG